MDPKKEKYRRIRGAMLKLLACEHPGSIDSKMLHYLLEDLRYVITEEECESHSAYLEAKGFVKRDRRKTGKIELNIFTITPAGLDVLDGFVSDVGIDTNF